MRLPGPRRPRATTRFSGWRIVVLAAIGAMVDRFPPRWVLPASMSSMTAAMVAVPFVQPGVSASAYGMAIGAAGSAVRVLEAAVWRT